MAMFKWEAEYALGHAEIDEQHRQLITIMNHLYEMVTGSAQAAHRQAEEIISELAVHISTHFAYEEELMVQVDYPTEKIAEHVAEHNRLITEVQAIVAAHRSGDPAALTNLLPLLHGQWLADHICEQDRDYSGYLLASEKSPPTS